MGYSPWGHKKSDITGQLNTAQHNKYYSVDIVPKVPLAVFFLNSFFIFLFSLGESH